MTFSEGKLSTLPVLLAFSLLLATLLSVSASGANSTYGFRVRLTTTSDWTRIEFDGATTAVFTEKVLGGSEAEELRLGSGARISVNKAQFDETKVVVEYSVYLHEVSPLGPTVSITKGGIGYTRLEFLPLEENEEEPFLILTNRRSIQDKPENEKKSLLPGSMLPPISLTEDTEEKVDEKVLAFYYPWYGTPEGPSGEWVHWDSPIAHEPGEGYYDSKSPETIRRHVTEAKEAGIDGFIASWWGPDSFSDEAFEKLLGISEELDFRVTIYLETALSKEDIFDQLSYAFENYADSGAFLKVNQEPVVFFYSRVTGKFSHEDWDYAFSNLAEEGMEGHFIGDGLSSEVLKTFDGFHSYNTIRTPLDELDGKYKTASLQADVKDKLFAATVLPGYDDRELRNPGFVRERNGGELYTRYWDVATSSNPEWILITSYNEWHEGTEIEASSEYGRKYLDLTSYLVKKWKGVPEEES